MTMFTDLSRASIKRSAAVLALVALGAGLAACEHIDTAEGPAVAGWLKADTPGERHPIVVSQQPQTMRIRIGTGARGLTAAQRGDILAFANRSHLGNGSNTRVVINAPGGSANEGAAMDAVGEIKSLLASFGTPDSSISVEAYHAGDQREAPIKLTVLRYVAEAPVCGQWPENLANNPENQTYYNYGCADQKNLAAMVANPADLQGPRSLDPRPSERRDTHWGKYVKGDTTNASKSDDEKTSVKSSIAN